MNGLKSRWIGRSAGDGERKGNGTGKINVREWKEKGVFLVWHAQTIAKASGTTGLSNLIQSPAERPIHLDLIYHHPAMN